MGSIYKKPSTLCLPLSSQRDPAFCNRVKKNLETQNQQAQSQSPNQTDTSPLVSSPILPIPETQATEENRSVKNCHSDANTVLARYEGVLGDSCQKTETISSKSSGKTKRSRRKKLLHQMKPKVPFSIKEMQENKQLLPKIDVVNVENLEVEEITAEVLDSMLSELMNSGCENKIKQTPNEQESLEFITTNGGSKGDMKCSKSYNYDDISNNITRSQEMYPKLPPLPSNFAEPCNLNIIRQCNQQQINSSRISVESAMELHRSKSYIVNLIDRALSRELGTVVEDKPTSNSKDVEQVTTCPIVECAMKSDIKDKALCFEPTEDLVHAMASDAPELQILSKTKSAVAGESAYVKQLKQLRWGHLQNIEREVRRLEDLERFLDACSGDS